MSLQIKENVKNLTRPPTLLSLSFASSSSFPVYHLFSIFSFPFRARVQKNPKTTLLYLSFSLKYIPHLCLKLQLLKFLFQNSNGFQTPASKFPLHSNAKNPNQISKYFSFMVLFLALEWLLVVESTFRQSWLGFRPNSAHTGKSGAKDFMFVCINFIFISGMRPSLC
ncbi:hypothetical protein HanHA300_Chr03g0077571 [Helianthus annuus]|nr:hypothetical protein HanHA300_Chr03g0077571 [Helianthus annuus]KAJ0599099.1 hypothetical protein HanIR_Chr03g0101021 [Helianthus annuus]KAJ0772688.1 hypothetical protein HanOQP8_Chr03g0090251 [Helianthus annuus]